MIMEKKIETKEDGKDFKRFDDLLRQVVSVPKEEIIEREEAEKQNRKARKKK